MRIAYADPPYPGTAHRYPEKKEVNHRLLIAHLQEFDGWALSTASRDLVTLLPMCNPRARIGAWVRDEFLLWKPGCYPSSAWQPVIYRSAKPRKGRPTYDWYKTSGGQNPYTYFLGAKPLDFCFWVFKLLCASPDDEFVDIFPGSGAVTRAWDAWTRQTRLPLEMSG